jgi:tetratricopeptide (TPR) repeat protein
MNMIVAVLSLGLAAAPGAAVGAATPHRCAVPTQPTQVQIHACLAAVGAKGSKPDEVAAEYFDLASAYEAWGDRRRELDALNHAIALKPDFWDARVRRVQLYLQTTSFEQALPDSLALHKAFPGMAPTAGGGKTAPTGAAALSPAAFMVPSLQRELVMRVVRRCRAFAMVGLELDAGRKDCELALQLAPGNAAQPVYESLGIIEFREGNWSRALAEFDTVLKQDPNSMTSLYLKGITERRMGNVAGGDADLASAEKKNPQIAQQGKAAGFLP